MARRSDPVDVPLPGRMSRRRILASLTGVPFIGGFALAEMRKHGWEIEEEQQVPKPRPHAPQGDLGEAENGTVDDVPSFRWNSGNTELEIVGPRHPTYVPLSGNRCWALIPTDLDWHCYVVNAPSFLRVLRRIGLYLQVGGKRGPIPKVLENLRTFYGANYLRLTGEAEDVLLEIRVFPDSEESLLYLVVRARNKAERNVDLKIMVACDFEFHKAPWACKGFTEDATQDYSGCARKVNTPKDDKIKVAQKGSVFFVYDARNPGTGFVASEAPSGWTLDRSRFSFETPMSGYRPNVPVHAGHVLDLSNEETSDDSFCVFRHDLSLGPSQELVVPSMVGYQANEDSEAILAALKRSEDAFAKTSEVYQTPVRKGVKIETPDPTINAQFNLFNIFVKMNEHRCGSKHGFLPAAHYHNWLCVDFAFALLGYTYTNDLDPLVESMNLFRRFQHEDGFIPDLPLWTEGPSWRDRPGAPMFGSSGYVIAMCHLLKFVRDKGFAAEVFPSLRKAMEYVLSCEKQGLISPEGDFSFDAIDWPPGFGYSPQTFASVVTYKTLLDLRELAEWLGHQDYGNELLAKARQLKTAINDKLWMEDRGYYRIGLPEGKVGKDQRDEDLFRREMISWGSLAAVLWGVADKEKGTRAIENVKQRLFSPYGMKFFDPVWAPSYSDSKVGLTYQEGRIQNGAYWHCWWSISTLVRAELMLGKTEEAFKDLLEVRLDRLYSRFKMREKGKEMSFLRAGEWTDSDLTFPVTSIPYMLTAAFFNETLIEHVLGISVTYDEIRVEPRLPASWNGASVSDLKLGDSEWTVEIRGSGEAREMLLDGARTETIPITPGKHHIEVRCREEGGDRPH